MWLYSVADMVGSRSAQAADKVKVGFCLFYKSGDHGWTYAHEMGRREVQEHFGNKIETTYVENVPEGPDSVRVIRELAKKGQ